METIRVNMTPCEDIKTIHASQNDNEGREWGFELHNNGDKIDSSSITDQLVFKAYEGGTEQILPVNGSTPTTSPFLGDIRYPQGLLSDQEFLYRESPTEEDGLAKITEIKGNTIVWNQLVQNGNFADGLTNWIQSYATLSVSNGVCRATLTGSAWNNDIRQSMTIVNGHKYLLSFDYLTSADLGRLTFTSFGDVRVFYFSFDSSTTKKHYSAIETAENDLTGIVRFTLMNNGSSMSGQYYEISNVNLFDLTQMFGSGNEPSSVEDFTSLFPLPYYAYNQGTLLSFMGSGIKTVGKNLFNKSTDVLNAWINTATQTLASGSNYRTAVLRIIPSTTYTISKTAGKAFRYALFSEYPVLETTEYNSTNANHTASSITFTSGSNDHYLAVLFWSSGNGDVLTPEEMASSVMVEFGSSATNYEPYTSSTLSLPISTYFTNGMKSAGDVYDELSPSKAITRIGSVDLGSLTWVYLTSGSILAPYFYASFSGIKSQGSPAVNKANIICSKYQNVIRDQTYFVDKAICADGSPTVLTQIQIKDSSYTDATAFKNSLQGQYLYYEMINETETSFTTASLVTENAEIPLSNNDGTLIGKCTEQLSENPGFFDAKIKLADEDGECYSNKIQLHVERKPS